jgi:hypothetical protein
MFTVEGFNFKIMTLRLSACLVESQTFLEMFQGRIDVPWVGETFLDCRVC